MRFTMMCRFLDIHIILRSAPVIDRLADVGIALFVARGQCPWRRFCRLWRICIAEISGSDYSLELVHLSIESIQSLIYLLLLIV